MAMPTARGTSSGSIAVYLEYEMKSFVGAESSLGESCLIGPIPTRLQNTFGNEEILHGAPSMPFPWDDVQSPVRTLLNNRIDISRVGV